MRMSKQGRLQTSQHVQDSSTAWMSALMRQGRGRGVSCLVRGSVWVPICDSIVVARSQLHILDALSFGLLELLFSLIVVLARHVSEECIIWNSNPSCKYKMKTIQVTTWKMTVSFGFLDGVATQRCCSCAG